MDKTNVAMGNIWTDIVEDIDVKPAKSKLVIKWIVRIAVILIGVAFILGQLKIKSLNKVNTLEKTVIENTQAVKDLRADMNIGFANLNKRIDKVYDDGTKAFNDYQEFNKKQLGLVIDYGYTNKDLLKRILDMNMTEKSNAVNAQMEQAKEKKDSFSIVVKPVKQIK